MVDVEAPLTQGTKIILGLFVKIVRSQGPKLVAILNSMISYNAITQLLVARCLAVVAKFLLGCSSMKHLCEDQSVFKAAN